MYVPDIFALVEREGKYRNHVRFQFRYPDAQRGRTDRRQARSLPSGTNAATAGCTDALATGFYGVARQRKYGKNR